MPAADHVARRLVPADEQEQGLVDQGVVVEPVTVDLPLDEHAEEVVGGEAPAPLLDLLPHKGVPLHEGVGGLGQGIGVGRALGHEHGVGPLQQPFPDLGVEAQHVGDHDQGKRGGDVGHQVTRPLLAHPVDDLVTHLGDAGLARRHRLGGEPHAHQASPAPVLGGVHVDHVGERHVGARPARAREGLGVLPDGPHILVAGDAPDVVGLVVVGGGVPSHPGEGRERVSGVELAVQQIDVRDPGLCHGNPASWFPHHAQ